MLPLFPIPLHFPGECSGIGVYKLASFPRSSARLYTQVPTGHRHSGRDCRNPGYMDVCSLPSLALDTRFPAGMTSYLDTCV